MARPTTARRGSMKLIATTYGFPKTQKERRAQRKRAQRTLLKVNRNNRLDKLSDKFGGLTIEQIKRVANGEQFAVPKNHLDTELLKLLEKRANGGKSAGSWRPENGNGKAGKAARMFMEGHSAKDIEKTIRGFNRFNKHTAVRALNRQGYVILEKQDVIGTLLKEGLHESQIVDVGFNRSTVRGVRGELGGIGKDPTKKEIILDFLNQGFTRKAVTEMTGFSRSHVEGVARGAGGLGKLSEEERQRSRYKKASRAKNGETLNRNEIARYLLEKGFSIEDVHEHTGYSEEYIKNLSSKYKGGTRESTGDRICGWNKETCENSL